MKRINKVLLALVLTFGLFMVCDLTYADQMGPCSNDVCTLSVEGVKDGEDLLINPEFVSLDPWDRLYAISISSDSSFTWDGKGVLRFYSLNGGMHEYIPVGSVASVNGSNSKDGYFYVSTAQDPVEIGPSKKIIGYLRADEGAGNISAEFVSHDSYSYYDNDLDFIVNAIKDKKSNEYVDLNLFFGNFQYNYVVENSGENSWEKANDNSGKIIIDNTNSIADLNCKFTWNAQSSEIGLEASDSLTSNAGFAGDRPIEFDSKNTTEEFPISIGQKETFDFLPVGGNYGTVQEILNNGGKLGSLSLIISVPTTGD